MRTALLDRATSWCAPTNASNLPSCALEALRISIDGQASSSNSCSDADLAYYKWAIDGEDDPVTGGTQFNLERTEGPISGTAYDMDMGNCQCDDAMIPTCACAAIPPPPSPSHIEVDANLAIIIPAIVASIVVCSFFGYASRWCRRQDKPFNSNVDAQGHFRPQQQQQGGVQMAQYGHPQPPPPGRVRAPAGGVRAATAVRSDASIRSTTSGTLRSGAPVRSTASGAVRTDASVRSTAGAVSVSAAAVLSGDSLSWSGRRGDAR